MKHLKLLGLAGLLLGLTVVFVNCAPEVQPLETEADFTGFITGVQSGQISVESHADKIVTKYTITITGDTMIFRQDGDSFVSTGFSALANQQWIEIWFSGPVMESWPMQATAQQIVILE